MFHGLNNPIERVCAVAVQETIDGQLFPALNSISGNSQAPEA